MSHSWKSRAFAAAAMATTMLVAAPMAHAAVPTASAGMNDNVQMQRGDGNRGELRGRSGARERARAERSGDRAERKRAPQRQQATRAEAPRRAERRQNTQRREDASPNRAAIRQAQAEAQRRQDRNEIRTRGVNRSEERSGRDWNRSDRRSDVAKERSGREWNARTASDRDFNRNRSEARAETIRNRDYRDRDRNGSYRDRDRDGDRARDWTRDRDGNWRDRDGKRAEYRDRDHDRDRAGRHHRNWDRKWRNDRRYDWHRYRYNNRNIFRLGSYYSPYRDYRYNRLGVGFSLRPLFYSSRYWLNDPWRYRLPAVSGDYRWIRYYDDAVLVDTWNGEVVDVIHDFFW